MHRSEPELPTAVTTTGLLFAPALGAAALLAWTLGAEVADSSPTAPSGYGVPRAPTPAPPADTVVDGFHGYRFGTPGARIDEIDVSGPPAARHEGLEVYTRDLHFLGVPTRAYFYLDSPRHRLRRGKHLIEPDRSSCVRTLTTIRLMVAGTHPELEVSVRPGTGAGDTAAGPPGAPPEVPCPAFMEADSARERVVLFRNPTSGAVEARIELFRRGGEPRILACYLNDSDCNWPDSVQVRPGPRILAPARGPDTARSRRESRPDGRTPRRDERTQDRARR